MHPVRCQCVLSCWVVACAAALSFPLAVRGDNPPKDSAAQKAEQKTRSAEVPSKKLQKLSADEETSALEFARSQHPELAELLEQLKKNNPKEYGRALLDLHRAQDRIGRLADKNPERFALELALWRTESRIRLQAAQLAMGDESQEAALKPLLAERRELKLQLLQLDREKAVQRVAELDRQVQGLQTNPEQQDDQELAKLKQAAAKQQKATAKPAKKKAKTAAAPETIPTKEQKSKKPGKTNNDPSNADSKTEPARND